MLIIYDLASLPLFHVHVLIFVFLCSNRETIPNTLLVNYVWIPFIHHGVSRDSRVGSPPAGTSNVNRKFQAGRRAPRNVLALNECHLRDHLCECRKLRRNSSDSNACAFSFGPALSEVLGLIPYHHPHWFSCKASTTGCKTLVLCGPGTASDLLYSLSLMRSSTHVSTIPSGSHASFICLQRLMSLAYEVRGNHLSVLQNNVTALVEFHVRRFK